MKNTNKNILFINLSDHGPMGQKSTRNIKKSCHLKGQSVDVDTINMSNEALKWKAAPENYDWAHITHNLAPAYNEIVLAIHGQVHDIENCYTADEETMDEIHLMNVKELAGWLATFLEETGLDTTSNKILLSMCYAGRTEDYLKNHIEDASSIDFKQSFAYKLLDEMTSVNAKNDFSLRAYTGAVTFHESHGLVVETEEQIQSGVILQKKREELGVLSDRISTAEKTYVDQGYNDTEIDRLLKGDFDSYNILQKEVTELQIKAATLLPQYGQVKLKYDSITNLIDVDLSKLEASKNVSNEKENDNKSAWQCRIL